MATEKFLQGVCDLKSLDSAKGVDWNKEGCERFRQKDKQVIDDSMSPACLKVCGNCEYFTVWEFEVYPGQSADEAVSIGRVA